MKILLFTLIAFFFGVVCVLANWGDEFFPPEKKENYSYKSTSGEAIEVTPLKKRKKGKITLANVDKRYLFNYLENKKGQPVKIHYGQLDVLGAQFTHTPSYPAAEKILTVKTIKKLRGMLGKEHRIDLKKQPEYSVWNFFKIEKSKISLIEVKAEYLKSGNIIGVATNEGTIGLKQFEKWMRNVKLDSK